MSSGNSEFYLFISNWMPFISCLIAEGRPFNTMVNRSGESGHPCHVPDFRGKTFNFSPLSITLAVDLL